MAQEAICKKSEDSILMNYLNYILSILKTKSASITASWQTKICATISLTLLQGIMQHFALAPSLYKAVVVCFLMFFGLDFLTGLARSVALGIPILSRNTRIYTFCKIVIYLVIILFGFAFDWILQAGYMIKTGMMVFCLTIEMRSNYENIKQISKKIGMELPEQIPSLINKIDDLGKSEIDSYTQKQIVMYT
jgi:phage-related holin